MTQSTATTVAGYLKELHLDRRLLVSAVREIVNDHLPPGYDETMRWGMISWEVPLARYPETYNGQPLGVVALAAQKRYVSLYLMCAYIDPGGEARLRKGYEDAGKELDLGKSCIRFRSLDAFVPEAVIPLLEKATVEAFIVSYEASRRPGV